MKSKVSCNSASTDVADATTIADTATASGYDKREYYVFAATGTKDVAYQGLTAQMEYMKTLTDYIDIVMYELEEKP